MVRNTAHVGDNADVFPMRGNFAHYLSPEYLELMFSVLL